MADGQSVVADALHRESRPGERRKMRERELLERFVNGNDQAAFRALIDRHGPMVLGVCRSLLKEPHDAEDAFQNIFLILARRAGTIKHRDSIGPWLHRVAVRVATRARVKANDRRARERRGFRSKAEPTCDDYVRFPRSVLQAELNRLPERYRLPLVLCYLEGKTNEEAASQLQCPVGTVKGRLWRARVRLRDRLCRLGLSPFEGIQETPA